MSAEERESRGARSTAERAARQAAALRANLRRRKAQKRAAVETEDGGEAPADGAAG